MAHHSDPVGSPRSQTPEEIRREKEKNDAMHHLPDEFRGICISSAKETKTEEERLGRMRPFVKKIQSLGDEARGIFFTHIMLVNGGRDYFQEFSDGQNSGTAHDFGVRDLLLLLSEQPNKEAEKPEVEVGAIRKDTRDELGTK